MNCLRNGFLLLALLTTSPAFAARDRQWLPEGNLFPALLAATIEAHSYAAVVSFDAEHSQTLNIGLVAVGNDFGLYRWQTGGGNRYQLSLFADFQSQFNLDTSNQELINADYFVGFPLSWQRKDRSARIRLFHQSSHLGDEYILSGQAPPRERVSYEALDALYAYAADPEWRIYAGGVWVFRKQWDALGTVGGQAGVEYADHALNRLRGRWTAAFDVKLTEAFDRDPQTRLLAGVRWGGAQPGKPSVTLAATAFHGAIPFGQFFEDNANFFGLMLFLTD